MRELKRQISKVIMDYKNAWLDEVDAAKNENRSFRPSNVMRKEAEISNKIDIAFLDYEERIKVKGKKGLFGR